MSTRSEPISAGSSHMRLARSLSGLSAALEEQRAALALWRSSLRDLRSAVGGLSGSLDVYSTRLRDLKDRVNVLHEQARQS